MSSIILQVVNLFKEKNNPSLPLIAQGLGTGNTYLVNYPVAYTLCKEKGGLILLSKCFTSINNQETTVIL